MKITCDTVAFREAVANVSRAVSQKNQDSILSGILIKGAGETVTLHGYDLEMGITTSFSATVDTPGEIVLSARLLYDMLRRLDCEQVELCCDEKLLTVLRGGAAEFTILSKDATEFPDIPTPKGEETITLPAQALKSMIAQTIFAVSTGDINPVHTGSRFETDGETLSVISVDGSRLALRRETIGCELSLSFVAPGKTLSEIAKLIDDDDESDCVIEVGHKHVLFSIGAYSIVSRLLEGDFLNYRKAIPENIVSRVRVSARALTDCVERASLLITDRLRSPLRCVFADGRVKITCSTAIGKAYDETPCEITGEDVEIGFNNRYLIDALKNCDADEIILELSGPLAPMKILPPEGDHFIFLVLPVRM